MIRSLANGLRTLRDHGEETRYLQGHLEDKQFGYRIIILSVQPAFVSGTCGQRVDDVAVGSRFSRAIVFYGVCAQQWSTTTES